MIVPIRTVNPPTDLENVDTVARILSWRNSISNPNPRIQPIITSTMTLEFSIFNGFQKPHTCESTLGIKINVEKRVVEQNTLKEEFMNKSLLSRVELRTSREEPAKSRRKGQCDVVLGQRIS
jgi:hypothetical protein